MKNQKRNYAFYQVEKFSSIKEMLEIAKNESGEKIAFRYVHKKEQKSKTYEEFVLDTYYLGTALSSIDMTNNHIAVIGENRYEWIATYLTTLKTNGVIVPVDKELPCGDIINVLQHSDSEMLFYSEKFEKYIPEIAEKVPAIKYFVGFDKEEDDGKFLSYNSFIEKGKKLYEEGDTSYTSINTNTEELRMLVYTSGTTGMPKGVMLSEKNLVSSVYYGLQVSTVFGTSLSVLPYHHTYEAVAGLLVALHKHITICINDNLKHVLKNLNLYKPDYIYVVPAFAELFYKNIIKKAKESGKYPFLKIMIPVSNFLRIFNIDLRRKLFASIHEAFGGNLKKIVCGGAPLREELGDFFDGIGMNLINGYGITECSPLISANRDYFNDCRTVGTVLPCCEVKFDGVTSDGYGEICVRGDIVMMGYYKDKERTDDVLKDGWFYTGDYGKFNDREQLMITGRKKNMIVLDNGKNVFPEEIENYVMNIPYVSEVVVKGVTAKDGIKVELCAEVFLSEEKVSEIEGNIEEVLKKDINTQCEELPTYKRVARVEIRKEPFVKTTTNKIKR